jgi:hypothetical protein
MKSKPYYPELHRSICQTLELTDHLTKLTKNLSQEIKLTLEGKNPIQHYSIRIPLCCQVFSNNYKQKEIFKISNYMLN